MRTLAGSLRLGVGTAVLLGGLLVLGGRAQDTNEDRKALDEQVYKVLRDVINAGSDLYNRESDHAGCARLYQGALMTLRPLLDHHPELQKNIDTGLKDADRIPAMAQRAHALRKVLDQVRKATRPPGEAKK